MMVTCLQTAQHRTNQNFQFICALYTRNMRLANHRSQLLGSCEDIHTHTLPHLHLYVFIQTQPEYRKEEDDNNLDLVFYWPLSLYISLAALLSITHTLTPRSQRVD